jgi:hypothetical protein
MIKNLLQSFSNSNVNTEVRPVQVETVLNVLPQDVSHLNISESELHSPAMNAAIFSAQKGSVSVIEYGDQLVLFGITGQENSVILDRDTPLERVKHLILSYIQ